MLESMLMRYVRRTSNPILSQKVVSKIMSLLKQRPDLFVCLGCEGPCSRWNVVIYYMATATFYTAAS
jgi:hypothetical protein